MLRAVGTSPLDPPRWLDGSDELKSDGSGEYGVPKLEDRRRPRDAFSFKPVEKKNVHTMRLITQMRFHVRIYCEQVDKLIEICYVRADGKPWDDGPSSDKKHSGHAFLGKIRRETAEEHAVLTKIGASCLVLSCPVLPWQPAALVRPGIATRMRCACAPPAKRSLAMALCRSPEDTLLGFINMICVYVDPQSDAALDPEDWKRVGFMACAPHRRHRSHRCSRAKRVALWWGAAVLLSTC